MIALSTFLRQADNLGDVFKARGDAKAHMIADLMETGNFRERGDAVRQLHGDGHSVIDIMILVDEVIFECKQQVIAVAMSDEVLNHRSPLDGSLLNVHPGFGGSAS